LQTDINVADPNINSGVEIKSMISSVNNQSGGTTGLHFNKSRGNLNSQGGIPNDGFSQGILKSASN
jgi:hypothetical protein